MYKKLVCLGCLGLVLGLVPTNTAVAADPGLVGWWKFDESAGTTAADSSVSGNNGTLRGSPRWVNGQIDGAVYLNGTTDFIELPIGRVIDSLTDCTIGGWVYWTGFSATSGWQRIFDFGSSTSVYMFLSPSINSGGPMRFAIRTAQIGSEDQITAGASLPSGWHHMAVTINSTNTTITIYLDGVSIASSASVRNKLSDLGSTGNNWLGRSQYNDPYFQGYLDDFYIFSRVLSPSEILKLQAGGRLGRELASQPLPADKEKDVLRDAVLRWTSGISADKHRVYLGDSFDGVQKAGTGSPLLVSPGQTATSYDPGRLEFNRAYYWRVDEVNAPPDNTVFQGDVWSFTVEPYAYPIPAASITAAASSYLPGRGPEKTINGSGLNASDGHSTVLTDMWQTAKGTSLPAWIQYEFDKPYRLNKMLVWNYNGESFLAIQGAKEVIVEHSLDGTTWTRLAGVLEFPMASGAAGHTSDITVDFGNVAAQYVKITIKSNYAAGLYGQCGLSEVRLLAVPVAARNPSPAADANNVDPRCVLTWRPGREADHHRVYVGAQEAAVRASTAPVRTTTESQVPGSQLSLQLGQKYYWRVDEVNEAKVPAVWPGATWAFTTAPYLVVDDFESYGNTLSAQPFQTWIDGVGFFLPEPGNPGNHTGAVVGHDVWTAGSGHYNGFLMETGIAHGGQQSLPLYYDNSGTGGLLKYSQTDRTFAEAQDWTQFGITTLVVHFYGSPGNTGQLYVKIDNLKIPYPGNAADLATQAWTPWPIDLTSRGASLKSVSTLSIGVDGNGASGLLYIDDIRLK
jgi:hypothetical protein